VNDEFNRSGLRKLIDNQLGMRVSTNGYSYGNLFGNFFNLFLSGGECAEDIQKHFRPTLEQIPGNAVASADTLLRSFNELATENTTVVSSTQKEYQFNINEKLNDLNIKSLLLTKQLEKGKFYDLDFGWNHLPTSSMGANTVYLIITAMMKHFYNYLVQKVSNVFTDILPTSRLKRFIFRFIAVAGQYVYRGRQWILKLYTDRPYEKLLV